MPSQSERMEKMAKEIADDIYGRVRDEIESGWPKPIYMYCMPALRLGKERQPVWFEGDLYDFLKYDLGDLYHVWVLERVKEILAVIPGIKVKITWQFRKENAQVARMEIKGINGKFKLYSEAFIISLIMDREMSTNHFDSLEQLAEKWGIPAKALQEFYDNKRQPTEDELNKFYKATRFTQKDMQYYTTQPWH